MATWYLWAVDDHPPTNEYITRVIGEQDVAERMHKNKLCADGKRRNLYSCSYDEIRRVLAAQEDYRLRIQVFHEKSLQGTTVIARWVLNEPHVRRKQRDAHRHTLIRKGLRPRARTHRS